MFFFSAQVQTMDDATHTLLDSLEDRLWRQYTAWVPPGRQRLYDARWAAHVRGPLKRNGVTWEQYVAWVRNGGGDDWSGSGLDEAFDLQPMRYLLWSLGRECATVVKQVECAAAEDTPTDALAALRRERCFASRLADGARDVAAELTRLVERTEAAQRARTAFHWQLVREHVLLRGVGWFWYELPARASCAEREKKRAIVAFEVARF
jgi:hypothetical protein